VAALGSNAMHRRATSIHRYLIKLL